MATKTSKIMLLGIGSGQMDTAAFLKNKGIHLIGCANSSVGCAQPFLDEFYPIDIKDTDALIDLAQQNKVNIAISPGSDYGTLSAVIINESLGLTLQISSDQVQTMCHKYKFRMRLKEHGLDSIAFRLIEHGQSCSNWQHFPAILKPADSQGQRGITFINSIEDIHTNLSNVINYSPTKKALLEEFLDGIEYQAQSFFENGSLKHCYVMRREFYNQPYGLLKRMSYPSDLTENQLWDTRKSILRIASCFDIKEGPLMLQFRRVNGTFRIIEATPRIDGCHFWKLFRYVEGVDLLEEIYCPLLGLSKSDNRQSPKFKQISLIPYYEGSQNNDSIEGNLIEKHQYYDNLNHVSPADLPIYRTSYAIVETS